MGPMMHNIYITAKYKVSHGACDIITRDRFSKAQTAPPCSIYLGMDPGKSNLGYNISGLIEVPWYLRAISKVRDVDILLANVFGDL